MRRRVPRNFHSSGLDSRAPDRNAGRKTGHVRTRLSGLCCIYRPSSQIKKPSLSTPTKNIYLQAPPQLEAATRANLEKKVSGFVPDGGEVTVTATSLPFSLSLCIRYCTPKSL
ncbi:E2 binding domain containing protein [Lactarius tabidus]